MACWIGVSGVYVRGLNPEPSRHPALLTLQRGDYIGLFNLSAGKSGSMFTESPLTVIYKIGNAGIFAEPNAPSRVIGR